MMSAIPIILDGDPGHDDAIAWMLARASRQLEILACTSVSGNQSIEKTSFNARRVMTLLRSMLHSPWAGKDRCTANRSTPAISTGKLVWTGRLCQNQPYQSSLAARWN